MNFPHHRTGFIVTDDKGYYHRERGVLPQRKGVLPQRTRFIFVYRLVLDAKPDRGDDVAV